MLRVQVLRPALSSAAVVGILFCRTEMIAFADEAQGDGEDEPEEVIQELFLGSLAFPQEANELQASVISSWMRSDDADVLQPVLVGEWGFTDRLQIEVEAPFVVSVPNSGTTAGGLDNAEVGLLYNFVRSSRLGLVMSAGLAGTMPTASTDLIETSYGAGALLTVCKLVGPVQANLSAESGVEAPTEEGMSEAELGVETALSLIVPLGGLVPVVEVGWEQEEESELMLSGGLIWLAADGIEMGLAGLMARGDEETEWGAVLNFTWERGFGAEVD